MAESDERKGKSDPHERFKREVERKARRKLRARKESESFMFWLGMFGLVGWSVAIPTVLGAALGLWMDRTWPDQVSWTLTLLLIGVILGCLNAWYWVRQEIRRD